MNLAHSEQQVVISTEEQKFGWPNQLNSQYTSETKLSFYIYKDKSPLFVWAFVLMLNFDETKSQVIAQKTSQG